MADTADLREHLPAAVATDLPVVAVDTARLPEHLPVVAATGLLPAVVDTEHPPEHPVEADTERRRRPPVDTERRRRLPVDTERLPEARWSQQVRREWPRAR